MRRWKVIVVCMVGADYMAGINGFVFALARDYRKRPFSRKAIYDIPIGFSQTTGVE